MQRFYDRFHAKKNKAKQAKAKLTQIERIKAGMKAPPREAKGLRLGLPQPKPSARVVLEMKAPAVAVGSADEPAGARVLIRDVDLVLERGEKIALVGPNGAGKTTLVETVAGLRSVGDGAVHLGHNVRPAYYSQQGRELREDRTMLENVLPLVGHDEEQARRLLGRFLFTADEVEKQVGVLSGGERSRLRLLRLLVGDANFLLLDEPTNHLDVASVDALADGLDDYTGTLLLITHDRHLIDRVAERVLEIHDGRLVTTSPRRATGRRARRAPPTTAARPAAPARGDGDADARRQVARPRRGGARRRGEDPPAQRRGGAAAARPAARRRGRRPQAGTAPRARSTRSSPNPRRTPTATPRPPCSTSGDGSRTSSGASTRPGRASSTTRAETPGPSGSAHGGPAPPVARVTPACGRRALAERRSTLPWYAANRRDLPWRRTTDPYAVLVSEVMLQQTQVPRVVPRYAAFLDAFPTLETLAGSPLADVLRLWRGLGYNNRAVRLRRCAQALARGRRRPPRGAADTLDGLVALPGIGPYTARAVLVFARNADLAAVDANVRRVLTHELDLPRDLSPAALQSVADALLPRGRSRDWHNALMDYGSLVLTARATGIAPRTRQGALRRARAAGTVRASWACCSTRARTASATSRPLGLEPAFLDGLWPSSKATACSRRGDGLRPA